MAGVVEEADADVEEGSGVVAAGRFFVADVDVFKIMEAKEGVGSDGRDEGSVGLAGAEEDRAANGARGGGDGFVVDETVVGDGAVAEAVGENEGVELAGGAVECGAYVGVEVYVVDGVAQEGGIADDGVAFLELRQAQTDGYAQELVVVGGVYIEADKVGGDVVIA